MKLNELIHLPKYGRSVKMLFSDILTNESYHQFIDGNNLTEERVKSDQSGLEIYLYISTEKGNHAPRVKLYTLKYGDNSSSISFLIAKDPDIVFVAKNAKRNSFNERKVAEFIIANYAVLYAFWFYGNNWSQQEIQDMLNGFIKV